MVFSSLEFIYLFLPPVLIGFLVLRHLKLESGIIWWLIATSVGFYAWWSPIHVVLLIGSVLVNYALHRSLMRNRNKTVLVIGIVGNLALLGFFKYADFAIQNLAFALGWELTSLGIVLPLAISFFTFQQISFLLDTWSDKITACDFKRYVLFVTFFPQLIAGPIVLQKDTIPQFQLAVFSNRLWLNLMAGSTLFIIGLFKKIVLADGIAPVANAVFAAADGGQSISTDAAWMGTLAYSFQIYFDFSGYCDMALGLARLFGIRLPINFNSPYKALSISDFWKLWHITLSRFLRDYLYIPLGGNRSGFLGQHGNLMITMLLGGLWHGAGWNFIIWGGLHGAYLIINHAWRAAVAQFNLGGKLPLMVTTFLSWGVTMLAIMLAWVFFRAETFGGALNVAEALIGLQDTQIVQTTTALVPDVSFTGFLLALMVLIVTCLPNSIELVRNYQPVIGTLRELKDTTVGISKFVWRPSPKWGVTACVAGSVALIQLYRLNDLTEFIYFNF